MVSPWQPTWIASMSASQTQQRLAPNVNSARSSRVASGAMRSLSPALQVMQRSLIAAPGLDTHRGPAVPVSESLREFQASAYSSRDADAAASGAASSGSARQRSTKADPFDAFPSTARCRAEDYRSPPASAREVQHAHAERTALETRVPQSAREGHRPASGGEQRRGKDKASAEITLKQGVSQETHKRSFSSTFGPKRKDAASSSHGTPNDEVIPVARAPVHAFVISSPKFEFHADPIDDLDALVASLDGDKNKRSEAPEDDARSTIATESVEAQQNRPKCGIAGISPIQPSLETSVFRSVGFWDDEDDEDDEDDFSVGSLFDSSSDRGVGDSATSLPGVYCSRSASLISVHFAGSASKPLGAVTLDSDASLVFVGGPGDQPSKRKAPRVRFECHIADADKAPQPPRRRPPTKRGSVSRPLGCTGAIGGA